jgi:hypothetical protein
MNIVAFKTSEGESMERTHVPINGLENLKKKHTWTTNCHLETKQKAHTWTRNDDESPLHQSPIQGSHQCSCPETRETRDITSKVQRFSTVNSQTQRQMSVKRREKSFRPHLNPKNRGVRFSGLKSNEEVTESSSLPVWQE